MAGLEEEGEENDSPTASDKKESDLSKEKGSTSVVALVTEDDTEWRGLSSLSVADQDTDIVAKNAQCFEIRNVPMSEKSLSLTGLEKSEVGTLNEDYPSLFVQNHEDNGDRELAGYEKGEVEVSVETPGPCIDQSFVSIGSKVASSAQFLKSLFMSGGSNPTFTIGSISRSTWSTNTKGTYKQRVPKKSKEVKGSLLAKSMNRELDEEMEDVDGSKKKRVVYKDYTSVEASDQPC